MKFNYLVRMDYANGKFSSSCLEGVFPLEANTKITISFSEPLLVAAPSEVDSQVEKIVAGAVDYINACLKDSGVQVAFDTAVSYSYKITPDGKHFITIKFEVRRA